MIVSYDSVRVYSLHVNLWSNNKSFSVHIPAKSNPTHPSATSQHEGVGGFYTTMTKYPHMYYQNDYKYYLEGNLNYTKLASSFTIYLSITLSDSSSISKKGFDSFNVVIIFCTYSESTAELFSCILFIFNYKNAQNMYVTLYLTILFKSYGINTYKFKMFVPKDIA